MQMVSGKPAQQVLGEPTHWAQRRWGCQGLVVEQERWKSGRVVGGGGRRRGRGP